MRICQSHWDRLRKALDERGLSHLGAKNAEEAKRAIVTELEGRGAENDFDPLMACNNMIMGEGIKTLGLGLLVDKPDGSSPCPICEIAKHVEEAWILGPAEAVLEEAREKGLIK